MESFFKVTIIGLLGCVLQFTNGQQWTGPPSPPIPSDSKSQECIPGELLPGPECDQFYKCVPGKFRTRRVLFQCAPGTQFSQILQTCFHGSCKPPLSGGATIGPVPNPPPSQDSCISFELDSTSKYDCHEPGFYASPGNCLSFYVCVNTMACLIKGFQFKCPNSFQFSSQSGRCLSDTEMGECLILSDDTYLGNEPPAVELQTDKLDDFFGSNLAYWDLMQYIPPDGGRRSETISPGGFSRDSSFSFQNINN